MAGDSANAARALGYRWPACASRPPPRGGFIAGLGGASLSLYYPGSWNEGMSSGQGLIAVALVIFARWSPLRCLVRGAAVRRRRRARAGAAVGRRQPGLLPVQRGALCADAGDPGADLQAGQRGGRQPGRTVFHALSKKGNPSMSGLVVSTSRNRAWWSAWCSCSCRWSRPRPTWRRRRERICELVAKARRNQGTMDLVVFPEYALHGLSMDTSPGDHVRARRPGGGRLSLRPASTT